VVLVVLKKLINLLLILTVASSVAAGMPLHSNEQECSMGGEMDCCKKALLAAETPQVTAARLCCAVNCSTEGTTNPTSNSNLSPQSQPAVSVHPAAATAILNSHFSLRFVAASHGPPAYSEPAYILHLALLI
jgi:hypothetical protein